MAGGKLTKFVDEAGFAELEKLLNKLGIVRDALAEDIVLANQFNNALAGAKGGNIVESINQTAKAIDKVAASHERVVNAQKSVDIQTEITVQNTLKAAQKRAEAEEKALNKYLVDQSKQQAARDAIDAKQLQKAQAQADKLQQIADKAAAKRASQDGGTFIGGQGDSAPTDNTGPAFSATALADQQAKIESIAAAQTDSAASAAVNTSAIQAETEALTEQEAILNLIIGSQRENALQVVNLTTERAANIAELKTLNITEAEGAERAAFLTEENVRLSVTIRELNSILTLQAKQQLAVNESGKQLNATLDLLRAAYNSLDEAEKQNIETGVVLKAEIDRLDVATKELAESQGVGSKSVGLYGRAIEKAGKGLELGDKVANQFTRSIIRMGVQFLLIGVIFGAITWLYDLIKNLDIFTGRLDKAVQNLKALNEVQKDAAQSSGEIVGKYRILSDTVKDLSISYENRLRAATELKKLFPVELEHSTAQAIANGEEAKTLDKLTDSVVKLAKAKAAATQIEKTEGEIIALQIQKDKINNAHSNELANITAAKGLDVQFKTRGGNERALLKQESDQRAKDAQEDADKQIAIKENTIKYLEQYGGLQAEAESLEGKKSKSIRDTTLEDKLKGNELDQKAAKDALKAILDDENQSYDARIAALKLYYDREHALILQEQQIKLSKPGLTKQQKTNIGKETNNQQNELNTEQKTNLQKINEKEVAQNEKQYTEIQRQIQLFLAERLSTIKEEGSAELAEVDKRKNDRLKALADEGAQGLGFLKDNSQKKIAIQKQAQLEAIAVQIDTARKVLEAQQKSDGPNTQNKENIAKEAADKKTLADLIKKYDDEVADNAISDDQRIENSKKKIIELSLELAGKIQSIADQAYQAKEEQFKKEKGLLDRQTQAQEDAVSKTYGSEQNKADKLALIKADAYSKQQALDQKIHQQEVKKANFAKALALASIVYNTETGVAKAFADYPFPYDLVVAGIVAANGIAAGIKASSAQVPGYYTGTSSSGEGLAWVGERGAELRINPDGSKFLTPSIPTLAYLEKGTKIVPHQDTLNIIKNQNFAGGQKTDWQPVLEELQRNTKAVQSKQPVNTTILTEKGLRGYTQHGASKTEWLRRNGINR